MITWTDVAVRKLQHQERLREAEKSRLIRQAQAGRNRPSIGQKIWKGLFQSRKNQPDPGRIALVEETG